MKRVNAIAKGKATCITDLLNRKANRIMRGVEQAIDFAADKIEDCKEAAESVINSLGEVADSGMTATLQSRINDYCNKIAQAEEWEAQLARLKDLKKKLEADVKVEEE